MGRVPPAGPSRGGPEGPSSAACLGLGSAMTEPAPRVRWLPFLRRSVPDACRMGRWGPKRTSAAGFSRLGTCHFVTGYLPGAGELSGEGQGRMAAAVGEEVGSPPTPHPTAQPGPQPRAPSRGFTVRSKGHRHCPGLSGKWT